MKGHEIKSRISTAINCECSQFFFSKEDYEKHVAAEKLKAAQKKAIEQQGELFE